MSIYYSNKQDFSNDGNVLYDNFNNQLLRTFVSYLTKLKKEEQISAELYNNLIKIVCVNYLQNRTENHIINSFNQRLSNLIKKIIND